MMQLDSRQRAMLQEMGIQVWLPEPASEPAPESLPELPAQAPDIAGVHAAQPEMQSASQAVEAPVIARAAPVPRDAPPADYEALDLQQHDWPTLVAAASTCAACGLCSSRRCSTLLPPADAAATAPLPCDWMVVGDVPDAAEDAEANPFAGNDGVLLDNVLRALSVRRVNWHPEALAGAPQLPSASAQRAYVTNVVKCRPGHGQIPEAADLAQCAAYLRREIALVQPKVIVALGRFAQQVLLADAPELAGQPLGKLRGLVHRYAGIPVVVSYHPKQLMRAGADNAKARADAWADWCLAAEVATSTDHH